MSHDNTIRDLVLDLSCEIFPTFVAERLGGYIVAPDDPTIATFFEQCFSLQLHATIPETVTGFILSKVDYLQKNPADSMHYQSWDALKTYLLKEVRGLLRNTKFWNAYYRLFYEIMATVVASKFTGKILSEFCRFLRFDGTQIYSDVLLMKYLNKCQLPSDEDGLDYFLTYTTPDGMDSYHLLPSGYRHDMLEATKTTLYEKTKRLSQNQQERGGPQELLMILTTLVHAMKKLKTPLPFSAYHRFYPYGDTSTNPVQAFYNATVSGLVDDIIAHNPRIYTGEDPSISE